MIRLISISVIVSFLLVSCDGKNSNDKNYDSLMSEAMSYGKMGNYEKSVQTIEEALTYKETLFGYYNLGVSYTYIDDVHPEGEKAYLKGLQLSENADHKAKTKYLRQIYYNLACIYSLRNEKDEAFIMLNSALDSGYSNFFQFTSDKDLENVRKDERFGEILKRIHSN